MSNNNKHEKDELSGIETTGHEWDGLKELNTPAPRWWLWVFIITIIWSVGYWIVYPAWPTLSGNTKGTFDWTSHKKLSQEQMESLASQSKLAERIHTVGLQQIQDDPELYAFAVAGGKKMFRDNCAACHGTGAEGRFGYPNLNDDDWLWGGDLESIYKTIKYGIRSGNPNARDSMMPAFGEILKPVQIEQVAQYVQSLSGKAEASPEGEGIFKQNCASCHGAEGKGGREFGAPNLTDAIWLYSNDKTTIHNQIRKPHHGIMPSWEGRLSDEKMKQLTIYVHSLGGGEPSKTGQ